MLDQTVCTNEFHLSLVLVWVSANYDVTVHIPVDAWWPGVGPEKSEEASDGEGGILDSDMTRDGLDGENRLCSEYRSATKNKADITTTTKVDFEPIEISFFPPNLNAQPQRCNCFSDAPSIYRAPFLGYFSKS